MISIVCVYNNEKILKRCLLDSLKKQSAKYELILLDNTNGKWKSAASALNNGGRIAKGDYIMFVHQDIDLPSPDWLEKVEEIISKISDLGIAGVAGMSEKGKNNEERGRGYISDSGEIWKCANPVKEPEEVQTLDECLFIIPKSVFSKIQFDEKIFDGWHYYAADYCLSVRERLGLKAYVIPAFVFHRSPRKNVKDILKYQIRLYRKHKKYFPKIFTTTGEISSRKILLRRIFSKIRPIYRKIFWEQLDVLLMKELSDCRTVLDLGCGYNSPVQFFNVSYSVGVEIFEPYLIESFKKGIHSEYIRADIRKVNFKPKSFDAVICIEVLEPLNKEEGIELIKKMEEWATKKIIITTPNGFLFQDAYHNNPFQEHKSGWTVKDFKELGFEVYGLGGWKRLRGYKGSLRYEPYIFWQVVSDVTQKMTFRLPNLSFQLFAVKRL